MSKAVSTEDYYKLVFERLKEYCSEHGIVVKVDRRKTPGSARTNGEDTIRINPDYDMEIVCGIIVHEIVHIVRGDKPPFATAQEKVFREILAQLTSFVLCGDLGIKYEGVAHRSDLLRIPEIKEVARFLRRELRPVVDG